MYQNLISNSCIPFDRYDSDHRVRTLVCPVCGHNCSHIAGIQKDDPRGWGNYGNVSVEIWGECEHTWTIFFNDHKGAVLASIEYDRRTTERPRKVVAVDNTELTRLRAVGDVVTDLLGTAVDSMAVSALCADCGQRTSCEDYNPGGKCTTGGWFWSEEPRDPATDMTDPTEGDT